MPKASLAKIQPAALPVPVSRLGPGGAKRFAEFFAGELANNHTRAAYARAVRRLCDGCDDRGPSLAEIEPVTGAAYVE